MEFAGINYLAVGVAAIAAFLAGWPWYWIFGKPWLRALGRDPDQPPAMRAGPFIVLAIALIAMAWVLAGTIGHLGADQVTARNGIISGAFVWFGFVITAIAVNYSFQGRPASLTLIDGGYFLLALILMGGIIGALGV